MLSREKKLLLFVTIFLITPSVFCREDVKQYFYVESIGETLIVKTDSLNDIPDNTLVYASFRNDMNNSGWNYLEIVTSESFSDELQTYWAGYLEGYITNNLIWMHYLNVQRDFCDRQKETCNKIFEYLNDNLDWMANMIDANVKNSEYWYQVYLFVNQLEGLVEGYNAANGNSTENKLSYADILFLNLNGDLEDLVPAVEGIGKTFINTHCSALIKILPENSDVLFAHVTWTGYENMLRIQKVYNFKIHKLVHSPEIIPGHTISYPSYPGILVSIDDFYITSAKLAVMETTLSVYNTKLWKLLSPKSLLYFVRVAIANRLATSGKSWTKIFEKYNSGTYNNQWMIVDYKQFTPGNIGKNFFWVLEQMPKKTKAADMTSVLKSKGFWASYNIAYFPNIFDKLGTPDLVRLYGDWFSFNKHPRALIFNRDQNKVKDMDSMLSLMRYNDYKNDPLSACNCTPPYSAANAISSRSDLNPKDGIYPFQALGNSAFGAIDVKITSAKLSYNYKYLAVAGPTYNESRGIPPFNWDTSDFKNTIPHFGQPTLWKFEPVINEWESV